MQDLVSMECFEQRKWSLTEKFTNMADYHYKGFTKSLNSAKPTNLETDDA